MHVCGNIVRHHPTTHKTENREQCASYKMFKMMSPDATAGNNRRDYFVIVGILP